MTVVIVTVVSDSCNSDCSNSDCSKCDSSNSDSSDSSKSDNSISVSSERKKRNIYTYIYVLSTFGQSNLTYLTTDVMFSGQK